MSRLYRILLDPAAVEGGAPEPTPAPADAPAPPEPKAPEPKPTPAPAPKADAPDPAEGFRKLADKHHGDLRAVAETLYRENYELRERNRELKGAAVPEGATVLKGDHAKAYDAYKAFGTPDDIRAAFDAREDLQAQLDAVARSKELAKVAQAMGWDAEVFEHLAPDGVEFEVKAETKLGKPATIVYAKGVGAEGKDIPLSDYAATAFPKFLPALAGGKAPEPTGPRIGTPRGAAAGPMPAVQPAAAPRRSLVR